MTGRSSGKVRGILQSVSEDYKNRATILDALGEGQARFLNSLESVHDVSTA